MAAQTKIVVGVLGGYLLGRTKKFRLALTLGSMLAGQRLVNNREDLLAQGSKLLEGNPQLKALQSQLTGRLVDVAREAALVAVATRVEALTKSIQPRQKSGAGEGEEQGGESGSPIDTLTKSLPGRGRGPEAESQKGQAEGDEAEEQPEQQADERMGDEEESDEADDRMGGRDETDQMGDQDESEETDEAAGGRADSDEGDRAGQSGSSGSGFGGSPSQSTPSTKKTAAKAAKAAKGMPGRSGKRSPAPRTRAGRSGS
ncbi:MAG: hypothetical protein ACTHJJ_07455 [Intrasporangium sp.]|uniref:hypothetical protein n=1 Tax=Intrasporangium sp. TaxID=1925024 RepID=UPI003F7E638A